MTLSHNNCLYFSAFPGADRLSPDGSLYFRVPKDRARSHLHLPAAEEIQDHSDPLAAAAPALISLV